MPTGLRRIRLERRLTQNRLAERIGVTPSCISRLESGANNGTLRVWDLLEEELQTSQKTLRRREDPDAGTGGGPPPT
jgi:transcriptional regulator with XRE-family HTH domain